MYPFKKFIAVAISSFMIFAGVSILLYSPASQWFTQKAESEAIANLNGVSDQTSSDVLNNHRHEAIEYNEKIHLGRSTENHNYNEILDSTGAGIVGRLRVPSIKLDQTIRPTLDESVLVSGLGHLQGSSLPVGGESTHAVIGGHRGLATAVGFTNLDKANVNDEVFLEVLGKVLVYKVTEKEILEPGEAEVLPVKEGKDILTLITCTPLGINTHRIVVTAERLIPAPVDSDVGEPSDLPGFPWWAMAEGVAAVGALSVATVSFVRYRRGSRALEKKR